MKREELQRIGAPLIRVTGADNRGDLYFTGSGNVVGVLRSIKDKRGRCTGYAVLTGLRGRTDHWFRRAGCDYQKVKYPVYERMTTCKKVTAEVIRTAVAGVR